MTEQYRMHQLILNLNSNNIHMTFNYSLLNNLLPANAELNRSSYETDIPEDVKYTWNRDNHRQVHNLRYSFVYDISEKTEAGFQLQDIQIITKQMENL